MKRILKRLTSFMLVLALIFAEASVVTATNLNNSALVHNAKYSAATVRPGIDVSSWQGNIDWNAVANSGVQFVFIRMAYRASASGTLATDTKAIANLQGALNAGLQVGVYIYSQAINQAEAEQEADYICDLLNGYNISLPVAMDYEYKNGGGRLHDAGISKEQGTANAMAFCARVSSRGYVPMVYSNKNFLENQVDGAYIGNHYRVWLANYTNQTSYSGEYSFWQHSSSGTVDGISGNVDCDVWYDFGSPYGLNYSTHVQDYGWQRAVAAGETAGTSGQSKRLEAIVINETANPNLGVEYRTHIQDYGWESEWRTDGQISGTSGQSKRLEAIQIRLTGSDADNYDIYYTTHVESYGWLNWAKNGEMSGTSGYGYRMEAIRILILPKGSAAPDRPGNVSVGYITNSIIYNTHVQDYGWQNYVTGSEISGTSGQSKRLEGIHIILQDSGYQGGIEYRTHIQDYGWENDWKSNGQLSGTTGESKRLEAIQIRLNGDIANYYNVYYRVHCQNLGWMGWACNGESAGSTGYSYRLEAIQIMLVPKGMPAPGSTSGCFAQR